MTYNVFGGTLSLTQSISQSFTKEVVFYPLLVCLSVLAASCKNIDKIS